MNIQELADNSGTGDLHQNDVVQADAVVRVEKREAALDLVSLDHSL